MLDFYNWGLCVVDTHLSISWVAVGYWAANAARALTRGLRVMLRSPAVKHM